MLVSMPRCTFAYFDSVLHHNHYLFLLIGLLPIFSYVKGYWHALENLVAAEPICHLATGVQFIKWHPLYKVARQSIELVYHFLHCN